MLKTTGGFVIPSLLSPRGGRPPSLTRWRTHFFKRGTVFWPARSLEAEFSNRRIRTIAATHDVVTRRRVMSRHRMADGKSSRHPGCNGSCISKNMFMAVAQMHVKDLCQQLGAHLLNSWQSRSKFRLKKNLIST